MKPLTGKHAGIYVLYNMDTGDAYIGSTGRTLQRRTTEHLNDLLANRHSNTHLQNAFNKYGRHAFCFLELEQCPADKTVVLERENWWINDMKSTGINVYNICPVAGTRLGSKLSEESKERIKNSHWTKGENRGEIVSRMRQIKTGVNHHTDESKEICAAFHRGRKRSQETRDNISKALKGKPKSEQYKQAMKDNHWTKDATPEELQAKMSRDVAGEKNPNMKMSKDDLRDVVKWLLDKVPHRVIAERKGVSKAMIDLISRGASRTNEILEILDEMKEQAQNESHTIYTVEELLVLYGVTAA